MNAVENQENRHRPRRFMVGSLVFAFVILAVTSFSISQSTETALTATTWAPHIVSRRLIEVSEDWKERNTAASRMETTEGHWALELVPLGGKYEGFSDARVLDSSDQVVWEGRIPSNVWMSSHAPSFAATNPYTFGAGVEIYNIQLSSSPVFKSLEYGGQIICSENGGSFAVNGAGKAIVVSTEGEILLKADVPYLDYHLGAVADNGAYLAIFARDSSFPGIPPGVSRRWIPYGVSIFNQSGKVYSRLGPFPQIPRSISFQDETAGLVGVAGEMEVSVWSIEGAQIWRDTTFNPDYQNDVWTADLSPSGTFFVLGNLLVENRQPLIWIWAADGRQLIDRGPLPAGAVARQYPLRIQAISDTTVIFRSGLHESVVWLKTAEQ